MRASRLLSALLLLQTRGRMSASELAAELEVSVRTVYRDMEALSSAGVPVYGDAGRSGGYQLVDGYRTRLTGLTAAEAESLFLTGIPGPAAELGLGGVLAAAELKLLAALPGELRVRAEALRGRFHLDAAGWFRPVDRVPMLGGIAAAVWEGERIAVRYRRWREPREVERVLEPLGLVVKAGLWYLVAQGVEQPGRVRTYRVAEVLELTRLGEGFVRPGDFDLAVYWSEWARRYEREMLVGTAVVRLSPKGMSRLAYVYGDTVAAAVVGSAGEPDERGWVVADMPIEQVAVAHDDLLKLGAEVEVLAPQELRTLLTESVRTLAAAYLR
ncbi:helix-turn-helix transcriptional regulator [Crossiella cryophila]|uniref:Putative DNA-binding transcriptional regulator YafY n=1 Tax=Crossiella cryophila TaxID=43355 RepID=A0A7W7CIE0_9PSEU|nr:WYL domain-containing protein [Crossiella cryophila]MBB4681746.1 putative DNA-binding transcriptional regulator YafY [Crossiella cryophila]